ncbi:hypothetical protein HDU81_011034 [Chytriomyces hyalinus]|nr:hypothetical protein HDU81_011034 [Chytriomyces hyalinus]
MVENFQLIAFSFRTRAERVVWCFGELGVPFEVLRFDMNDSTSPGYMALAKANTRIRVPALIHTLENNEQFVLTESMAILRYLASLPSKNNVHLIPANAQEAARMDERIHIGLSQMDAHLWLMFERRALKRATIPEQMDSHSAAEVSQCVHQNVSKWLKESEFIAGNSFTIADILFTHLLDWTKGMAVAELEPHVLEYLKRMEQRPAYPPLWKAGFQ